MSASARLVDLSHPIEAGMITYPGLPAPVVSEFLSRPASAERYSEGTTFSIGRVEMVANTGTYVDAPSHRFPSGADIAGLDLEAIADLPAIVLRAAGRRAIDAKDIDAQTLRGKVLLIHTAWSQHWRTPAYAGENPYLTRASAERLVAGGAALVGIDSLNIDDTRDGSRPAHTLLLSAGIPIVEHLTNLDRLPTTGFRFHCAPAPFRGLGSFPVRAYAVVGAATSTRT